MTVDQKHTIYYDRLLNHFSQIFTHAGLIWLDKKAISDNQSVPSYYIDNFCAYLIRSGFLEKERDGRNGSWSYRMIKDFRSLWAGNVLESIRQHKRDIEASHRDAKKLKEQYQQQQLAQLDEIDGGDPRTPLEKATETFNNVMGEYQYGFIGDGGYVWCTSKQEAADKASAVAMENGIDRITLVQKIGVVKVEPQVSWV